MAFDDLGGRLTPGNPFMVSASADSDARHAAPCCPWLGHFHPNGARCWSPLYLAFG
jgi:hypothetical protein